MDEFQAKKTAVPSGISGFLGYIPKGHKSLAMVQPNHRGLGAPLLKFIH
jgi:hypothetical protein